MATQGPSIKDPAHWQRRAREMRSLAREIKDKAAQETMLRIAREYERLAERAGGRSEHRGS